MRIELKKNIQIKQMEFVGEVDFFEESPYIELLKDMKTEKDLVSELQNKNMPISAIKNIINRFEDLKVLRDGYIIDVQSGFPEKEYGKYSFEYFENDTSKPFKFLTQDIKREKAVSRNSADNILDIERNLLDFIIKKNSIFKTKKEFEIIKIENRKGLSKDITEIPLELIYDKNEWKYQLKDKKFDMESIDFNKIFKGDWDEEYFSFKVEYSWIKNMIDVQKSFKWSSDFEKYSVAEYGDFSVKFEDIPIIPKTEKDALEWFLSLLKLDIEEKNRYISKDELQQLWINLKENKPKFQKFELNFNFKTILNQFGRESKYYWLLQAGIDLYPFYNRLIPKEKIIVDAKNDADLFEDLFEKFHIAMPEKLVIIDRWIVNLEQFKALEKLIEILGNPETTIITQSVRDRKSNKLIEEIITRNNIRKIEKNKNDIIHSRYWIFDTDKVYQTAESLDFISVDKECINLQYTNFNLFEDKDLDPKVLALIKEAN